jgi:putative zinc finger/helix-turn-helix YgiT family protein
MLLLKTCPECLKKTMTLVTDRYCDEVKYDGKAYPVDLPAIQFFRCSDCGSIILPDEADKAVGIELRRVAGLLMPDEIKANRKRLNLTQRQLAEALGTAEETICRWETGGQIQQRALDKFLRTFFEFPSVRDRLTSKTKCDLQPTPQT